MGEEVLWRVHGEVVHEFPALAQTLGKFSRAPVGVRSVLPRDRMDHRRSFPVVLVIFYHRDRTFHEVEVDIDGVPWALTATHFGEVIKEDKTFA